MSWIEDQIREERRRYEREQAELRAKNAPKKNGKLRTNAQWKETVQIMNARWKETVPMRNGVKTGSKELAYDGL